MLDDETILNALEEAYDALEMVEDPNAAYARNILESLGAKIRGEDPQTDNAGDAPWEGPERFTPRTEPRPAVEIRYVNADGSDRVKVKSKPQKKTKPGQYVLSFGKYKGQNLKRIAKQPEGLEYLRWLWNQTWIKLETREALAAYV